MFVSEHIIVAQLMLSHNNAPHTRRTVGRHLVPIVRKYLTEVTETEPDSGF